MIQAIYKHRPIVSCDGFHFLLHYVITIHQRYRQMDCDRETDGHHAFGISAMLRMSR